jgi:hypothetical protein
MEGKSNIRYSADDIRKYLEGQLTNAEMQAMEKAALEDPFLSDAMEGIEESRKHSVSFESGISDLQKRLADRISQTKQKKALVFQLAKWQVAAGILLVMSTATFVVIQINQSTRRSDIANTLKKDSGNAKSVPSPTIVKADSSSAVLTNSADDEIRSLKEKSSGKRITRGKKEIMPTDKENVSAVKTEDAEPLHLAKKQKDTISDPALISANAKTMQPTPAAPAVAEEQLQGKASGIEVQRSRKQSEVYEKRAFAADSSNAGASPLASPVAGWETFYRYINTNKKILTSDSLLRGEEIISFLVHPDGKLSSFKIEKSLSTSHDVEIERLIRSGPAFKVPDGKKQRCRVTVTFP